MPVLVHFQNQVPQPAATKEKEDEFPVAAIICIAIGAYVVVIAIILLIRQILLVRVVCDFVFYSCLYLFAQKRKPKVTVLASGII